MHHRPYEKLIVWQEAYKLCLCIYDATENFPPSELYGLQSQLRRAAASICLNIAEGSIKKTIPDKLRFMGMAHSSLEELHCGCKLSKDLHFMASKKFDKAVQAMQRTSFLLMKFTNSIQ